MIIGLIAVLLSSIFAAGYYKYCEHKDYGIFTRIFWQYIIGILIAFIYFRSFQLQDVLAFTYMDWFYIFALVIVVSLGAYGFTIKSAQTVGGTKTGTLDYLEPMIGVILAMLIFGESLSLTQLFGWGLILFTIFNIKRIK